MTDETTAESGTAGNGRREYRVNVLDRAITILRVFNDADTFLSLGDISRRANLHRSTALRLLSTLCRNGFVVRDEISGRYSLGYELIALAETAKAGTGIVDWAKPVMRQMRAAIDETIVISVRSGDQRVDLDQVIGQQPLRRIVDLGKRKPLTSGAPSLCILSAMSDAEIMRLCAEATTDESGKAANIEAEEVKKQVCHVRTEGFAEYFSTAVAIGSAGIAAPVRDARGEIIAAVGASIPLARYEPALREKVIGVVKSGAETISAQLGRQTRAA